ncbi:MAG TPA: hypothetical protein VGN93_13210 [Shinella sp.]|jgi:hypothetical protein|uniref:hypothetical protein n=1 Tax=Shinella sp. TaxID=1870904 RepID=UPI002E0EDB8B|nr:hypothetical protein [Shinella sp.]
MGFHSTTTLCTVADVIALHRRAVEIDEASFDPDGIAVDKAHAAHTLRAEVKAFKLFAAVQCLNPEDVAAKVAYVLNGSVGERTTLMECLTHEVYGGHRTQDAFLRSLHVAEPVTGTAPPG